jgi:hypothetical protein
VNRLPPFEAVTKLRHLLSKRNLPLLVAEQPQVEVLIDRLEEE